MWVVVAATGRKMPLNPEPREDGNVYLNHEGKAVVLGKAVKERLVAARDPGPWYATHFATCPKLGKPGDLLAALAEDDRE